MKCPHMNNCKTLFLTCANEPYYHFAVPFIYTIFKTQKDCSVEIFVESEREFTNRNKKSLELLDEMFDAEFVITETSFKGACPNTIRFIRTPTLKADYVYISDIDIFYTEKNIAQRHLNFMRTTGQDFSNIMRPKTDRMTGLHFSKWDAYYPIPENRNKQFDYRSDEVALYHIVKLKTGVEPNRDLNMSFRPVHGIHSSPNRKIDGQMNWGIDRTRALCWKKMTEDDDWQKLFPTLNQRFKKVSNNIDAHIKNKFNL